MTEERLFVRGLVAHLVADWLLQNDWMARHKHRIDHPAAWVHSGLQAAALAAVFGPALGLVLGVAHLVVDLRKPLQWWRGAIRQTVDGPVALHVAIWGDQVVHLAAIALAAWIKAGRNR
jgi:hypothetical protein